VLDDHDRRVRHVDPDLDHARRDEHVQSPAAKPSSPGPALRFHAAVQKTDSVLGEHFVGQVVSFLAALRSTCSIPRPVGAAAVIGRRRAAPVKA
jgi:hypothetical protein